MSIQDKIIFQYISLERVKYLIHRMCQSQYQAPVYLTYTGGSQFVFMIVFPHSPIGKTVSTASVTEPTTAEFLAGKIYKFFFLTNHESGSVGKTPLTSYLTH